MKKLSRSFLSAVLCLSLFLGMGISASAETSSKKQNLLSPSTTNSLSGVTTSSSLKDKLDECVTVYNDYQKIKSERKAESPDKFTIIYDIEGVIKQIDVIAASKVKKDVSQCNYYVYDNFSVCYYYSDDGYPRFALITDKSGTKTKEYRMYLYGGEVIKWVDNNGDEYYEAPDDIADLYDLALLNYARAMYDRYDKGKYAVQVGCFTDKDAAESCKSSMEALGESVVVSRLDNVYCVVSEKHFDNWDDASKYGSSMQFSDDCGTIFVRLI